MEPSQRNHNYALNRRPSTEKSRLDPPPIDRFQNYPSVSQYQNPSRPQTNLKVLQPLMSGLKSHPKVLPKGTRIVLGGKKQPPVLKGKPYYVPRIEYMKDPNAVFEGIIGKARMTTDYFYSHLPKLRPGTHDLPLEALHGMIKPDVIRSQRADPGFERKNRWEIYYGSNNPQIPYEVPLESGLKLAKPVATIKGKRIGMPQPPQTAQVKSRAAAAEKIMRLSTPQTGCEKRPDSRYNKATLCAGLNNGRDKSPEYRVPVLPMKLSENLDKHHVLPTCWQ